MSFEGWRVRTNISEKTYNHLRFSMVCMSVCGSASHTLDLHMSYRTLSGGFRGGSGGSLEPPSMPPFFVKNIQ